MCETVILSPIVTQNKNDDDDDVAFPFPEICAGSSKIVEIGKI